MLVFLVCRGGEGVEGMRGLMGKWMGNFQMMGGSW